LSLNNFRKEQSGGLRPWWFTFLLGRVIVTFVEPAQNLEREAAKELVVF
jgi:hypothetical protein